MITELVLGSIIFIILYLLNKKPANLPPGIWGWPFFGSLPRQDVPLINQINEHRKKYGDLFVWRIAGVINVFICKHDLIKAALKMPELSDRPDIFSFDAPMHFEKLGVVNANGRTWQMNRRFTLRHLKNLGLGRSMYEDVIQDEVLCLIKDFKKNADGPPKSIPWSLNVAILNVIWRICADRRYEVDNKEIHHFHYLIDKAFRSTPRIVLILDLIPWLHKVIPNPILNYLGVEEFLKEDKEMQDFLQKVIDEHKATFDPENPRDYIDHYLIEMEEQKDNPESTMKDFDLLTTVFDLFIAGSETTSSTIRWSLFYLAKYPDIQKKMHKELDTIVGRGTYPSLAHRERLPYFEAVCYEVQRIVSLVPLSLPHSAQADAQLNGYLIPKGAVVTPCLTCSHYDPELWKNPNEFDPENFLDADGQLLKNRNGFMPFSIGKRICLGESLAVMEIFLFLSALLHNFSFSLPKGEEVGWEKNPQERLFNLCNPYNLIIKNRD